ncbi:sigma-70 family RNA polymerase sigma factor [Microbacterium sp.]|uniref:RNA polymerase sigma factor n=1 Tax=Microbacterium sp. TaxID=51671 RepID=UPI002810B843|nr:sigma-70 family RNA polymerase sigma factor [Microbacterium sp.]
MPTQSDDQELAARAAAGDQDAFRSIYRAYARPVYWIAHGILSSSTDAEDIMQETFVVAWRKLPGLRLASPSLLPWLATICRLQAANRLRVLRRDRANTTEAAEETLPAIVSVEDQVISAALAERIAVEVQLLDELDQQIFRLCAVDGYAYQSAAERLGVSHAVVRNRLSRVRTRLRGAVTEVKDA